MKNLPIIAFILAVTLSVVGCTHYKWNKSAGKSGEGRCQIVNPDGTLGSFVDSDKCGK